MDTENKKALVGGMCFVLMMILVCVVLYEPLINFFKNPQEVKLYLKEYGIIGQCVMVLMMCLQVIFVFLPGEIIEVMAGLVYGPLIGMLLCLVGAGLGSIIIFYLVKGLGFKFIDRFIGRKKLEEVHFLQDSERLNIILFIIFFIPGTPKDLITYFIPFTKMKLSTFLVITTLARIPSIITSTISGNAIGLKEYELSLLVFGITAIFSIIGLSIYKNHICKVKQKENL